ncbi:hypothetical protein HMI54_001060 [Coelomomyces lativittatus]|nr:hypothetical protein HMI56_006829 [Coelomomyces lativittatus]KAJ1511088.1 hypothetical protein HMI54_001060 [Coelomomyces lativittatus]KAJ1517979.1 hypothetical protein HMI55_004387 [Coelomomyces lativittatus]
MDDNSWDDAINDILNSDDDLFPSKKPITGGTKSTLNVETKKAEPILNDEKSLKFQEKKIEIKSTARSEASSKTSTIGSPAFSFAPSPTPTDQITSSTPKYTATQPLEPQGIPNSLFSTSSAGNKIEPIASLFGPNTNRSPQSKSPSDTPTSGDDTPKVKKPTSQNNLSSFSSFNDKPGRVNSSPLQTDDSILPDFLKEDPSRRRRRPQSKIQNLNNDMPSVSHSVSFLPTSGSDSSKFLGSLQNSDLNSRPEIKDPLAGLLKPMPQPSSKVPTGSPTSTPQISNLRATDPPTIELPNKQTSKQDMTEMFEKLNFILKDFHQQQLESIQKLTPSTLNQSIQKLQDISEQLNEMNTIEPKFSSTFSQMQKVLDQFLKISSSINYHAEQLQQLFSKLHEENKEYLTNKITLETSKAQFQFEQKIHEHQQVQFEKMQEMYQEQLKEQQKALDTRVLQFEHDKRQWQLQCQSDREQQKKLQVQIDILQQEFQSRMTELNMDQVQFEKQKAMFQATMTKEMNRVQQKAEKIGLEQVEVQLAQHHVDAQREKLKKEREGLEKWVKGLKEFEYGAGTGNSLEWDLLVKEKEKMEKEKSMMERDQMWMTTMCLNQMGYELPPFQATGKNAIKFTTNTDDHFNGNDWNQTLPPFYSPKRENSPGLTTFRSKHYFTLR